MNSLKVVEDGLINVYEIDSSEDVIVSGRELYEFLEVNTRYNDWFKRMVKYGFEENSDYILVTQKRETNNPKNPYTEITDHHMKLDMAKEISMIQRTDKGKMARQYFIETEKKYRELTAQPPMSIEDLIIMQAQKLKNIRESQEKIEQKQKEQESKVVYLETEFNKESLIEGYVSNDYIARDLNIFSTSDKPHFQFIDAVARELRIYNNKAGYKDEYVKVIRDDSMGGIVKAVAYYSDKGVELISSYIEDEFIPDGKFYVRGSKKGQFNESFFELGEKTYKFNKKTYNMYKD